MTNGTSPRIFDRTVTRHRRDRASGRFEQHAFLFDEVADRVAERLGDVMRTFPNALDIGGRGGVLQRLPCSHKGIVTAIGMELSPAFAGGLAGLAVVGDEETLPFADASFDLVVGAMSLHWVNDLPGALIQIRRVLKPDGFFCAAMLGGDTLVELRRCLMEAELSILGGAATRVSPFAGVRDAGDLLRRAGFALPVADADTLTVTYADPFALLRDLRGMGETAAPAGGNRPLRRDVLFDAMRRYTAGSSEPTGRVTATFEIIYLSGWGPHENQPKPLRPGSAAMRLAEAIDVIAGTERVR